MCEGDLFIFTYSYVWGDSSICTVFIRVRWLVYVWHDTLRWLVYVWHDSLRWLVYVWHDSWLIHMYDLNRVRWLVYVWHDTFICMTWIIHMYDLNHPYVWGELCDLTHPHVWLDSSICSICICADIGLFCEDVGLFCGYIELFCGDIGLFHGNMGLFCKDSKSYIHMYDLTHPYVWLDSSICAICMTQHMYLYVWHMYPYVLTYGSICMCHMYPYVWPDSSIYGWVESSICVSWVIQMYVLTCMCWHIETNVCVDT